SFRRVTARDQQAFLSHTKVSCFPTLKLKIRLLWFPCDHQTPHGAGFGHGVKERRQSLHQVAENRPRRVRNPAKILSPYYLEPCFDKRGDILLQRGNVALFALVPSYPIFHLAPEEWKTFVHIDNNTYPSWHKQIGNALDTLEFRFARMTIANRIYREDE